LAEWDVVVIGAGPGGYPAAIRAAQLGLKTACIEREKAGGVCLNWGCIPSKALLKTAELVHEIEDAASMGLSVSGLSIDYAKVIGRSRKVSERFEKGVHGLFKKYGVTLIRGDAKILAANRVSVAAAEGGTEEHGCKHLVVATGARAKVFPGLEPDGERVVTYREAIVSTRQPKSAVILGSGAIGMEFAYFWRGMGAEVTVVEALDEVLPREDREAAATVRKEMARSGIKFLISKKAKSARREGDEAVTELEDGTALRSDVALIALGISPNTAGFGLEGLGVKLDRGFVAIDPFGATNVPNVWSVGDCTTRGGLAHTAMAQGHTVAEKIAGKHAFAVDYSAIPSCTYCQPQLASVGMTEEQVKASGKPYKVGRFPFSANGKAQGAGHPEGFAKVLIDEKYGEILGAHIVGSEATELVAELTHARTAEATAETLLHTVHAHPTHAEALYEAVANALGVSVHI
jgi:dihydrolipoamide dehydrogenase